MKLNLSLKQSNDRAKIFGIILIIIGIGFLFNPTSLNIKIAFASILIGIFMIFMITEKTVPEKISTAQIKGDLNAVKKIIRQLNLDGNAVFLPKSEILNEERILIPPNDSGVIKVPNINDDHVFLTGPDGKNLGISIPPSGLKLLNEIEKEGIFENTGIENIEEKLQKFVGMDLLKSVSLKRQQYGWDLELERPIFCPRDQNFCRQYPCPTCSAILTAITRIMSDALTASNKILRINSTTNNGRKTTFHLNFVDMRLKQGN